jgi:hypothetical protein
MPNAHDIADCLLRLSSEATNPPTPVQATIAANTVGVANSSHRGLPSQTTCHAVHNLLPTGTNRTLDAGHRLHSQRQMHTTRLTACSDFPTEVTNLPTPVKATIGSNTVGAACSSRRGLPSQTACHAVHNPFPTSTNRTLDARHQLHSQCQMHTTQLTACSSSPAKATNPPTPVTATIIANTVVAAKMPHRGLPSQTACHAVHNPFPTCTNCALDAKHRLHGRC